MLRRAAPLIRTLRTAATTAVAQSSTTASHGENVVVSAARKERNGGNNGDRQKKPFKREFKSQVLDEQTQLMRRHIDSIENAQVESLSDAIERINWYSTVSKMTLEKVAKMMKKSSLEELSAISDRAMATLFSSFGEICKESRRDHKKTLMESVVKDITDKGYSLGPLTRAAIFASKVDIAQTVEELPSVVDEISAWESAGLSLNEEVLLQAARVYALQGDKRGVIELTNYSRESFGRVQVPFLHWLAFSMITSSEGNGIAAIERLARSAPDSSTQLWLNGAAAAAYKGNLGTTVECLSRVPLSAKINHSDQNGLVVDILIQLIERQVEGAEQALTPFLSLTGDGTSLHERHGWNSIVVFKTRRAANEGKLEVATRLYSLVHEMHKNKYAEGDLSKGVYAMAQKKEKSIEEVVRCAKRLQESGIIQDSNSFLLSAFKGDKLIQFINQLRTTKELPEAVRNCRTNNFSLAAGLAEHSSVSPISVLPPMAALLYSDAMDSEDRDEAERILFKAAKESPEVIIKVLDELAKSDMADADFVASRIISSAIARILVENDVLSSGRIEKILDSSSLSLVRLVPLESRLVRLIRNAKDGDKPRRASDIVAKIIIGAFKNGGRNDILSHSLVRIVGNTIISDDKIEMLVNTLSQDPSVGISISEMEKAQKEFKERGLKKRVKLVGLLQRKSNASKRWLATPPEDLEKELIALESEKKEVKEGALMSLRNILMTKLVKEEEPFSTERLIPLLEREIPVLAVKNEPSEGQERDKWEGVRLAQLRDLTGAVYVREMKRSVLNRDWNEAARLWRARGTLSQLPVAASLALSYHEYREGSKDLSGEIITTIRSDGHSVGKADLVELGEYILDFSLEELASVSEWLKRELRLEGNDVERINYARTKRSMEDFINGGKLLEAFKVMKENSEKSKTAIGHFDLMRSAIRDNNEMILKATIDVVSSLHSKASAILDCAYSMLLENRRDYAEMLFKKPQLKLSYAKLSFFIKNSVDEKRPDVVHALFSILASCPLSDEKVSNVDLNYLAAAALRGYDKSGMKEAAKNLIEEIERSTLVVERRLAELISRVKKSSQPESD